MNSLVRIALSFAHMPEATINDLDKALPGFANDVAAFKELEPILTKAEPHLEALLPLINQAMPIIKKAWPDLVSQTPTVKELIDFASG